MAREHYVLGVRFFAPTGPAECVFHGFIDDPSGANELVRAQAILNGARAGVAPAGFINSMVLLMCETAFISSLYCSRVGGGGGNQAQMLLQTDEEPGAQDAPVSASQVATCMIWISADAEGKTGRNFIPAVADVSINNGRFTTTHKGYAADFAENVIAGLSTDVGTFKFGIWDAETKTAAEITDGYLSRKPGTQRRREVPL